MTIPFLILTGMLCGLTSALCGVGGGIVLMPIFLYVLQYNPQKAIATSLAVVAITSISSTLKYSFFNNTDNLISWRIPLCIGFGSIIATWFGAEYVKLMSSTTLTRIFGCVMVISGISVFLRS